MKRSKESRKMNRRIGCDTVNRMNLEKPMDMEVIKRINDNLLVLAGAYEYRGSGELKDWQKKIMNQ